jgi:hypothetical protein
MDLAQLEKSIPNSYTLTISKSLKRDEGDWWGRWTWTLNSSDKRYESTWFGFSTLQEVLEDLSTHLDLYSELFQSDTAHKDETEEVLTDSELGELFRCLSYQDPEPLISN